MRPLMFVSGAALSLIVGGCSETTVPKSASSPLVGGWISPQENLQPAGYLRRFIAFGDDGKFTYSVYSYGIYGGNNLAAYTRELGTYVVDGDRLALTVHEVATWDSFYGPSSPQIVEQVSRTLFDQARFTTAPLSLTLNFITYPADAPVPATLSFTLLGAD